VPAVSVDNAAWVTVAGLAVQCGGLNQTTAPGMLFFTEGLVSAMELHRQVSRHPHNHSRRPLRLPVLW